MSREPYLVRSRCGDSAVVQTVQAVTWATTASLAIFFDAEGNMIRAFGLAQLIDITIPPPDPDLPAVEEAEPAEAKLSDQIPTAPEHLGQYL